MRHDKRRDSRRGIRIGSAAAAIIAAIGVTSIARSSAADDPAPEVSTSQITAATATIQSIDKANRMVSIKDRTGRLHDIQAGNNVDLDRLKVGQTVNATFYEEVALSLRKPGEAAPKTTETVTQSAGVTSRQASITAEILSVNANDNTVTLRDARGRVHMLTVQDPGLRARLPQLKVGDTVDVTYTQATAVSVTPANK